MAEIDDEMLARHLRALDAMHGELPDTPAPEQGGEDWRVAAVTSLRRQLVETREAIRAAEARIAELEGALKPFADAIEDSDPDLPSDNTEIWEAPEATNITYGHLRAASAILSGTGEPGHDEKAPWVTGQENTLPARLVRSATINRAPGYVHAEAPDLMIEAGARITELEAALKPFADALGDDISRPDDRVELWDTPEAMGITYGDLRRAMRALTGTGGPFPLAEADFDALKEAIEHPPEPNDALKNLMREPAPASSSAVRWTKASDRHPAPHAKYLLLREGFVYTVTPCYGMHTPWWVPMGFNWQEGEPVDILDSDQWAPLAMLDEPAPSSAVGEATPEMLEAGLVAFVEYVEAKSGPLPPDTPENAFRRGLIIGACSGRSGDEMRVIWDAMRAASLSTGTKEKTDG